MFLGSDHEANERRTLWVVAITATMMVGEIAAGAAYGSMALLADGFHMATHALALGVAAAAYVYARKQARNDRYTFGTGKIGELAGFSSALALGLISIGIGVESVQRLLTPHAVAFTQATVVAAAGLMVNIVSALMLSGGKHQHRHAAPDGDWASPHDHGDHHHHGHAPEPAGHGRPHHDNNLRSAYVHVLADALTSVLAIVALLAGRFLGWVWLDALMGIVGAAVIANWSWTLLRDTSKVLLDTSDGRLAQVIRQRVEADGDASVTDLHVWQVGPGVHAAIVALIAAEPCSPEAYKARLHGLPVGHVTIEATRCAGEHGMRTAA
ncbi:MAG TPA: CDF family Co(II)/Ni(II) efflux transporter DmeF [Phenylobacterium sp.]|jgi:cation diffusion facilitator family transporter